MQKRTKNPCNTVLKTFGRVHRDEPHHLVYPLRFYAKRAQLSSEALSDWCGARYLSGKATRGARYRIETYRHTNGKRYVDRVFFEKLTEDEMMELKLRFGNFVQSKQIRSGLLRRPKLKPEEKVLRDELINQFYADVYERRQKAIAELELAKNVLNDKA